jgi:hypothetical protein
MYKEIIPDNYFLSIDLSKEMATIPPGSGIRTAFHKNQLHQSIKDEVYDWLFKNTSSRFIIDGSSIFFESSDEAMHFKLVFCEN